jgi:peptidyl-prolyl cis-trans isomerase A (cyclophilin A)
MATPNFPEINVPGEGDLYARLYTTQGPIVVRLEEQRAPVTVKNFVGLATGAIAWQDPRTGQQVNRPYYDGLSFHRVIPGFMIQGGCPQGTGRGGPGYRFDDEIHPELKHDRAGALSMANAGTQGGEGTNGSQFFITEGPTPHLNGRHSVFGYVVAGQDAVHKIATTPRDERNGDKPLTPQKIDRIEVFRAKTAPAA